MRLRPSGADIKAMAKKTKDDIRIIRPEQLPAVELLTGRIHDHAYRPHAHEEYAIGVVEAGVQRYREPGGTYPAPAGTLYTLNPGDVHAGEAATEAGYHYRLAYVPENLLHSYLEIEPGAFPSHPHFRQRLTQDPALAREFHRVLASLTDPATCRVKAESELVLTLRALFHRHGELVPKELPDAGAHAIRRVKEYIKQRAAEPIPLTEMAEQAGLSRYHFIRVFKKHTGLAPHAYLTQVRVFQAKAAIESGLPLADAALASGFADQSHMTRSFKAIFGITPGKVQKHH